jgi:hypothetical protein
MRRSPWIASPRGTPSGEAHLRVVLGWQSHLECLKPPPGRRENEIWGWKRELGQEIKKQKNNDKILVYAIGIISIGYETFVI